MPQQQESKAQEKQIKKTVRQATTAAGQEAAPAAGKPAKNGEARPKLNGGAPITNIAELQAVLESETAPRSAPEPSVKTGGKKSGRKNRPEESAVGVETAQNSAGEEGGKKARKGKKDKVIRDSFTMPRNDYDKIAELKKRLQHMELSAKKSELLRAGLHALEQLNDAQLKQMIEGVEKIKTGRPG